MGGSERPPSPHMLAPAPAKPERGSLIRDAPPRGKYRRRGCPLAIGAALLLLAAPGTEAFTGAEWRRLAAGERTAYVNGVVDAWHGMMVVQESVGTRDRALTVFADVVTCLRERLIPGQQVAAAVERYVEDNPGLRGKEMSDIVFVAAGQLCR